MPSLSASDVERILTAALGRPAGAELVFGALAALPGVVHLPAEPRRLLRGASPARLSVGDWVFTTTEHGNALDASHRVSGVVLSHSVLSPAEAARTLAAPVLEAARQQGPEAHDRTQAAIGALGEVLGL